MPQPRIPEAEFIELFKTLKSAAKVSKKTGVAVAMVHKRRRSIEKRRGIKLEASSVQGKHYEHLQTAHKTPQRLDMGILNGTVIVFSDAHFWPGIRTTAFKGLLHFIKEIKPKAVVN